MRRPLEECPADHRAADVTITVVEDPEQLKGKVNTIRLPDADEGSHAADRSGHQNESDNNSNSANEPQPNEAAETARDVNGADIRKDAGTFLGD
jgi:hypothetical protein